MTGEVRLRSSPVAASWSGGAATIGLYDYGLATYEAADSFRHEDAEGFVRLWGLGLETWAARQGPVRPVQAEATSAGDAVEPAGSTGEAAAVSTLWHGRFEGGPARGAAGLHREPALRPAPGARRPGRVAGPRPRSGARRRAQPGRGRRVLAALDQVGSRAGRRRRFVFAAVRRGHPHRGRAPGHRDRRSGRGQAAHRPQPQRPGRHRPAAVHQARAARSPVDARARPPAGPARSGPPGRRRLPARLHPPAAGPAGAAGPPPAGPRLGPGPRRRPPGATAGAAWTCRPLGAGALAGSSLPLDPGRRGRTTWASPPCSTTPWTPCPTGTSWPRPCSTWP